LLVLVVLLTLLDLGNLVLVDLLVKAVINLGVGLVQEASTLKFLILLLDLVVPKEFTVGGTLIYHTNGGLHVNRLF